MTEETCLANARIVLPDRVLFGQITLAGGKIAALRETRACPRGAIDCQGGYVLPGLIELHTDNLERHITPRPKVEWPHSAAILAHDGELAACGITTVFDAMRVGSIVSEDRTNYRKYARDLVSELLALRDQKALRLDHFVHLRAEICSETLVEELAEFTGADAVHLISMMDHTPGQRQFRDISKLRDYVRGKHGLSEAEFADHVTTQTALRDRLGARHEAAILRCARALGAVLASHDDTTADQVAHSAAQGIRLAEFPTTIEAAQACRDAGIAIIMGAPNIIRGGSHSGNVSALDLARRDLLDIVSSDYIPSALLLSAFRLADLWQDLPRAVRTVSQGPAQSTGLRDRGAIVEGLRGDVIRVDMAGDTPVMRASWRAGRRIA